MTATDPEPARRFGWQNQARCPLTQCAGQVIGLNSVEGQS